MTRLSAGVRGLPVSNGNAVKRVDAAINRALIPQAAPKLTAEWDAESMQAIASEAGGGKRHALPPIWQYG